jgi:hypothetical protein
VLDRGDTSFALQITASEPSTFFDSHMDETYKRYAYGEDGGAIQNMARQICEFAIKVLSSNDDSRRVEGLLEVLSKVALNSIGIQKFRKKMSRLLACRPGLFSTANSTLTFNVKCQ